MWTTTNPDIFRWLDQAALFAPSTLEDAYYQGEFPLIYSGEQGNIALVRGQRTSPSSEEISAWNDSEGPSFKLIRPNEGEAGIELTQSGPSTVGVVAIATLYDEGIGLITQTPLAPALLEWYWWPSHSVTPKTRFQLLIEEALAD